MHENKRYPYTSRKPAWSSSSHGQIQHVTKNLQLKNQLVLKITPILLIYILPSTSLILYRPAKSTQKSRIKKVFANLKKKIPEKQKGYFLNSKAGVRLPIRLISYIQYGREEDLLCCTRRRRRLLERCRGRRPSPGPGPGPGTRS